MARGVDMPWVAGQNIMDSRVDIPWVGGQNTMERGQNTMGIGVPIPWVLGSLYHGYWGPYTMGRGVKIP
jgi:hypothetical protein